jgi:hypothetical protein
VIANLILMAAPLPYGWIGLFASILFIGLAGLGLQRQFVLVFSVLSLLLWLLGSVVFAVGLVRAKAISTVAGGLVVLGAVLGPIAVIVGGQNPPPYTYSAFAIYGIGWVLVGYEASGPVSNLGTAAQAA